MKDAKKFIKAKKRKKLIKKVTLMTIVIVVALFIFFTKAPIFNIKSITFKGNVTIAKEVLYSEVEDRIGLNIFTVNQKSIKEEILKNRYVSSVSVKRKGLNGLVIQITEEAPVINENLDVIEEVDNLEGRNLVEIKGLDLSIVNDKSRVDDLHTYKNILANFYPFISQNKEEIHLSSLDISNIVNIIGYIGDIEIFFGDDSDLYNKMENVYRIILNDGINMKKGYINVSINGSPVIKNEPVEEDEAESNEENQVTDEFEQDVIIQGLE